MNNQSNDLDTSPAKDEPLKEDIRFLGRLLGDVVREQQGDDVFDLVESVRQKSIAYVRSDDENMAEDQHHIRRTRAHELAESPPRNGSMAKAFERAISEGATAESLTEFFNEANVGAVLTAHPTEVRRQSTMKREIAMSELLSKRDQGNWTKQEESDINDKLKRAVMILWQTNMLRQTKLTVLDEVSNALNYYDHTFFRELPKLYTEIEDELSEMAGGERKTINSFLKTGAWIGGDRDGNPFVNADVMSI